MFTQQQLYKIKKCPNSPLVKSPYIRLKIEGKNLEKALINSQIAPNFNTTGNVEKYTPSLEPFMEITLNKQTIITKPIYHNSPKWLEEFEFEVANNKTDRIVIEIYSKTITTGNETNFIYTNNKPAHCGKEKIYLGFQIIPVMYIEKSEAKGVLCLRLINKTQQEYFVSSPKHVLNIENHDPGNYKVDMAVINREKDIGVPLLKITYEYVDFYKLWWISCHVHSIIQQEDLVNKNKHFYLYKLYVKRNDEQDWFVDKTFEEIGNFRNYLLKYIKEINNYPFPTKSIFSYLPFINRYYSDDNNDILVEKKFILDNFFDQICSNMEAYKINEFNKFFSEDEVN